MEGNSFLYNDDPNWRVEARPGRFALAETPEDISQVGLERFSYGRVLRDLKEELCPRRTGWAGILTAGLISSIGMELLTEVPDTGIFWGLGMAVAYIPWWIAKRP